MNDIFASNYTHFRIDEELDSGAYKCWHYPSRSFVAMETRIMLEEELYNQAEVIAEASEITGAVKIIDCFYDDNRGYFVRELHDGPDVLEVILLRGGINEISLRELFRWVFETVAALHRRGIVHLGLSPSAVRIDLEEDNSIRFLEDFPWERFKIGHFHYSRRYEVNKTTRLSLGMENTAMLYADACVFVEDVELPFERLTKADSWSLGAIIYSILNSGQHLNRHMYQARKSLSLRRGSALLQDLVGRLLEINPEARLSIDNAISHPWFSAVLLSDENIPFSGSKYLLNAMTVDNGRRPLRDADRTRVTVHVEHAEALLLNRNCFCQVQVLGLSTTQEWETFATPSPTSFPVWNQTFHVDVDPKIDFELRISIMYKSETLGNDSFLGEINVPFSRILNGDFEGETVFDLGTRKASNDIIEVTGRLLIEFEMESTISSEPKRIWDIIVRSNIFKFSIPIEDQGELIYIPGESEIPEHCFQGVMVLIYETLVLATVFVTNCRVLICSDALDHDFISIPFGNVKEVHIDRRKSTSAGIVSFGDTKMCIQTETPCDSKVLSILRIACHNFVSVSIEFDSPLIPLFLQESLTSRLVNALLPPSIAQVMYRSSINNAGGSSHFLTDSIASIEVRKLLVEARADKFFPGYTQNLLDPLCKSYPDTLYFPLGIDEKILMGSCEYRSRRRLPVLTYITTGRNCIIRCAQPSSGFGNAASDDDQLLITAFSKISSENLIIVDARSKTAAHGNRFKGKGFEDISRYRGTTLVFMGIPNIHAMRNSIDRLCQGAVKPMSRLGDTTESSPVWLSLLHRSKWPSNVMSVLRASVYITRSISEQDASVLVHCSDGWDRTSQLCALSQIMLDHRYRTKDGFRVLIEKEFVGYGFKFADRWGICKDDERSPVFLQFLDCIYQLVGQFPQAFEFNVKYLVALIDFMRSGWFVDFTANNYLERVSSNGFSIWQYLNSTVKSQEFANTAYSSTKNTLLPHCSSKKYILWCELYLRLDNEFSSYQVYDYEFNL